MKATHFGHCQACGSLQKLPGGLLSLHGYSVTHGFFNGVCRGAKHQPFEKSCALVAKFIDEAKARLVDVEAFIAKLRTPATEGKAWVSNYEGAQYRRNTYRMIYVDLIETQHPSSGGGFYSTFSYVANGTNGAKNVTHKQELYDYHLTLLDACTKLNKQYADQIESRDAKNLKRYIKWQTERVANWKEAELLPVKTRGDKTAFQLEGDDVMSAEAE